MSFLVPDPAELRALAGRIAAAADSARARADRLGWAVATTGWHGPAARAFAGQAEVAIGGLRTSAGRLQDAAATLRRHADRVEDVVEVALRLMQAGFGPLPELLARSRDVLQPMSVELHDVATAAGDVISGTGHAVVEVAGHTVHDVLDCVGLG